MRLNDHLEHPEGALVFQRSCKMGLDSLETAGIALSVEEVAGLAQVQESGGSCGEAGGRGGLGTLVEG